MPAYDYTVTNKRKPWNKGLTKDTDQRVVANYAHLGESQYHTCPTCHNIFRWKNRNQIYCSTTCYWTSGTKSASMQGSLNPIFGGHRPETKLKMRQNHADFTGKKNGRWAGGKSFEPYTPAFNEALKEQVRTRDNHTCQLCDTFQNGKKHDVHHIDYNKANVLPSNLITLCRSCNSQANTNRDYWTRYFTKIMETKECHTITI